MQGCLRILLKTGLSWEEAHANKAVLSAEKHIMIVVEQKWNRIIILFIPTVNNNGPST